MENSEKKLEWKMQFLEFFFNLCKAIWENKDSEHIPEDAGYNILKLNSEKYVSPKKTLYIHLPTEFTLAHCFLWCYCLPWGYHQRTLVGSTSL